MSFPEGEEVMKCWVGLFYLRLGLFYLRLVCVAYGNLAWSFLLMVEIGLVFFTYGAPIRKLGLVFSAYGSPPAGNWFWSFLLTVPPP